MAHIPYGYKIVDGKPCVDKERAEQVVKLFKAYLAGSSYVVAGKAAGLDMTHSSVKNILQNRRYLGNEIYPAIIDQDLFEKVSKRIEQRVIKVKSERRQPEIKTYRVDTSFRLNKACDRYINPFEQAEYLYGLIERRANE